MRVAVCFNEAPPRVQRGEARDLAAEQGASGEARAVFKALTSLKHQAEIIPLEIEQSPPKHPWLKFAGMFRDDPLFGEVLAEIENYRRELDAGTAAA